MTSERCDDQIWRPHVPYSLCSFSFWGWNVRRQNNIYFDLPLILAVAFSSFLEWNSDSKIADAAEKLYGDINYLELYVGLQAEEAKPVVDGAGLCPGIFFLVHLLSTSIEANPLQVIPSAAPSSVMPSHSLVVTDTSLMTSHPITWQHGDLLIVKGIPKPLDLEALWDASSSALFLIILPKTVSTHSSL